MILMHLMGVKIADSQDGITPLTEAFLAEGLPRGHSLLNGGSYTGDEEEPGEEFEDRDEGYERPSKGLDGPGGGEAQDGPSGAGRSDPGPPERNVAGSSQTMRDLMRRARAEKGL